MKETLFTKCTALKIDWHWWRVKWIRRRMGALIEKGTPYSLPPLTIRSKKIYCHLREAIRLQNKLETKMETRLPPYPGYCGPLSKPMQHG